MCIRVVSFKSTSHNFDISLEKMGFKNEEIKSHPNEIQTFKLSTNEFEYSVNEFYPKVMTLTFSVTLIQGSSSPIHSIRYN